MCLSPFFVHLLLAMRRALSSIYREHLQLFCFLMWGIKGTKHSDIDHLQYGGMPL